MTVKLVIGLLAVLWGWSTVSVFYSWLNPTVWIFAAQISWVCRWHGAAWPLVIAVWLAGFLFSVGLFYWFFRLGFATIMEILKARAKHRS
jgi:hypothetical protein